MPDCIDRLLNVLTGASVCVRVGDKVCVSVGDSVCVSVGENAVVAMLVLSLIHI